MEKKEAKEIIEGLIQEKWFKKNFEGGSTEEALKLAIKVLES